MFVTQKKLFALLLKQKEVKQIGLTYSKMVRSRSLGDFRQETRIVGYINSDYARAYKRKTGETIKPMKRSWGERLPNTPLIEHNNVHYLSVKVIRESPPVFYYPDGRVVRNVETIAKILATKKRRDEVLKLRDFKLTGITRLTIGGKIYNVKPVSVA